MENNNQIETSENPIIELGLAMQKIYGSNIITEIVSVIGPSHNPIVTARITLPDSNKTVYVGTGKNQREARQNAAKEALSKFF